MTEAQFLKEMEEVLEFEPGTFKRGVELVSLPLWDSMQKLTFIALAEEKTGVVVDGTSVGHAKTVDDLLALIDSALE